MWNYEKRLEYPINIKRTDAAMAKAIISQFGGPDGETGAAMRYLSQRFSMPYRPVMGVLTDVGIEASNRNLPQPKHSPRRLSSGASFCLRQIPIYSNAITAPSYFSSMNFLISLSSLPSFTAMMFTYVFAASESDASYASASFFTEYPA